MSNRFRRHIVAQASIVTFCVVAITGCQTTNQTSNTTAGTALGAVGGCLGGAAIAATTGGDPRSGCLAGAFAGGVAGYLIGKQKDAVLAEQTRRNILADRDAQAAVLVQARAQAVPPQDQSKFNGAKTVDVVDAVVVNVPQTFVEGRQSRAASTLSKVGGYVSGAEANSSVIVSTRSQADYDYMVQSIRSGYTRSAEPPKVVYKYRQLDRGTQASVEVIHPVKA